MLAVLLLALPAAAHEVTGKVRVTGRADASVKTIVYAEAVSGPAAARPKRARLTQKDKSFTPRVVAVPVGSTVDFPNLDPIFHNAFSLSQPAPFDLGLYRAGESRSRIFAQPATYRIFCNIHPEMTAVLLVLPTDHITDAAADGSFQLDLPPGRWRVTAWSERAQPASVEVTVGAGPVAALDLALDESKFVELPHKNKFGQDYSKAAYSPKQ
jgi:plastocyanin